MFDEIIEEQRKAKSLYLGGQRGGGEIVSIHISNNRVISVKGGERSFRTKQYTNLIENLLNSKKVKDCYVNININDVPRAGFFNFSRKIGCSGQFLLPNHRFTNDDIQINQEKTKTVNFDEEVKLIRKRLIPFVKKKSLIFTSCLPQVNKIDYFKYAVDNPFCYGYLWVGSVHGVGQMGKQLRDKLKERRMVGRAFIPFLRNNYYKYVLYNDGFSLSDRMRLLLCLNSVIIRKKSPFEEFYTYKLKADVNFVEYENNEELKGIYDRLESNTGFCKTIINNNKEFINKTLTYDNILQYTADIINAIC